MDFTKNCREKDCIIIIIIDLGNCSDRKLIKGNSAATFRLQQDSDADLAAHHLRRSISHTKRTNAVEGSMTVFVAMVQKKLVLINEISILGFNKNCEEYERYSPIIFEPIQ